MHPHPSRLRSPPGHSLGLSGAALLLALLACGGHEGAPDAAGPEREASALTDSGLYRVSLRPAAEAPLGQLHAWIVRVEPARGDVASPARIDFDGGMPGHGHGFVTAPRVTRELGDGEYLVEGVKFHMAGEWELRVAVTHDQGRDVAAVAVTVDP